MKTLTLDAQVSPALPALALLIFVFATASARADETLPEPPRPLVESDDDAGVAPREERRLEPPAEQTALDVLVDFFTPDPEDASDIHVAPFVTFVGGGHVDVPLRRDDPADQREPRFSTPALGRLGMLGTFGSLVTVESEMEINAGPYGTSVWEGQAALQVRNQLIRLSFSDMLFGDDLDLEVGRITDPTSLNFFSRHTANLLLTDDLARTPLLMSGFNRGNGVQARYRIFDQLTFGTTLNAGNPTSSTGTLMIGGTFPPFARFYEVPHSSVGRDARGFPLSSFHVVLLSPSLRWDTEWVKAQLSTQLFEANTNTNSEKDDAIRGYNVRGGVEVKLFDDLFWDNGGRAFVNASRVSNDVVNPENLAELQPAPYEAMTGSAGLDLDLIGNSGVGVDGAIVREVEPGRPPEMSVFANAGATWWITSMTSLSGRVGYHTRCEDLTCGEEGRVGAWLTLRALLGPSSPSRP
jgi:hypothetical protein